jgi:hypothetical protein
VRLTEVLSAFHNIEDHIVASDGADGAARPHTLLSGEDVALVLQELFSKSVKASVRSGMGVRGLQLFNVRGSVDTKCTSGAVKGRSEREREREREVMSQYVITYRIRLTVRSCSSLTHPLFNTTCRIVCRHRLV